MRIDCCSVGCDDQRLFTDIAVAQYGQRWCIKDVYAIVKRLLSLAYF
ncbi:MAG: hypothetical protein M1546_17200 [Chloroflexi bacterium]|nr:hypothetical protein [Chloroflexota bacterium]